MDKEFSIFTKVELPENNGLDRACEWVRPSFTPINGIGESPLFDLKGMIVAFGFMTKNETKVIGSGVMVAPGVCLTATHVLGEMKGQFPFLYAFPCESKARLWKLEGLHALELNSETPLFHQKSKPEYSDVSIISCSPFSKFEDSVPYYYPPLEVCLPKVGERLWAVGYRDVSRDQVPKLAFFTSSGVVVKQYTEGRGRQLRSACLEIKMRVYGGMSGGPVFNEEGRVVGVISSCMEGHEDNDGPTFVTLIWTSLLSTVNAPWPSGCWPNNIAGLQVKSEEKEQCSARVKGSAYIDDKLDKGSYKIKLYENSEEEITAIFEKVVENFSAEYEDLYDYLNEFFESELEIEAFAYLSNLTKEEFQKITMGSYESEMKLFKPYFADTYGGVEDLKIHSAVLLDSGSIGLELTFNVKDSFIRLTMARNEYDYYKEQHSFTSFYNFEEDGNSVWYDHSIRPYFRLSTTFNPKDGAFYDLNFVGASFDLNDLLRDKIDIDKWLEEEFDFL